MQHEGDDDDDDDCDEDDDINDIQNQHLHGERLTFAFFPKEVSIVITLQAANIEDVSLFLH